MGNEQSSLRGLEIDEKATEVTDFWSVFAGEIRNENQTTLLSIFQAESNVSEQLWLNKNPLERAAKNLMLFRHPNILRYINSWNRGQAKILATERCKPLTLLIKSQNYMQICLGLRNILSALIFLVEQAKVRHLNVCSSSIYITKDGIWKLAGFQFLWPANEVTTNLLESAQPFRYNKAIDGNEIKNKGIGLEQYAFAVLCKEIFAFNPQNEAPFLKDFQQYCSNHLQHNNPELRPQLSAILLHPYFNQEFILIHSFLSEIPLKNSFEKQQFFTDLIDKLRNFDEVDVAVHLGEFLLSRLVLLDTTAQMCVTPFVLDPKCDDIVPGLFTTNTFQKYIIPKLKQVFCVHDVQIRLILLEHFHKFMSLFSEADLKSLILPQLLLGIKDTNDIIVSMTLRCLADLIPILGASVVIGKNRSRLFADGRPQRTTADTTALSIWSEPRSITPVIESIQYSGHNLMIPDNLNRSHSFTDSNDNLMPERLSPDGGEDNISSDKDDDRWSDWEGDNKASDNNSLEQQESSTIDGELFVDAKASGSEPSLRLSNGESTQSDTVPAVKKSIQDEIVELDIKVKSSRHKKDEEVDFFKDMEPIIEKPKILLIESTSNIEVESQKSNRLTVQINPEDLAEDGWDENISDWE